MSSSIETIVDGFPFPTINPIIRKPNYESIADIHLKLNTNSASVHSSLGCGTLSLLFFTVLRTVYATLSTISIVLPVSPRPKPRIPTGASSAIIADLLYHHTESTKIFTEYKKHGERPSSASVGVYRRTVCLITMPKIHRLWEDDYSSIIGTSLLDIC